MGDSDDFRKFSQVVRGISEGARSGTLFVRTSDHHASMVLFDQGNIVGAYYGSIKGRKAIALLRVSDGLTCHFEAGRPPVVRQDLRSPAETFAELIAGTDNASPDTFPEAVTKSTPRIEGASDKLGLDTIIARILARELAKYIGPAAQGVMEKARRGALAISTTDELLQSIGRLSADVLEPEEQSDFERIAIRQTNKLFTGEALDAISAQLVESLGPVGRNICDRAIVDLGSEVTDAGGMERLVACLVLQIDNANEAHAFVTRVRHTLDSLAS
jgi:hypothetical protein